ncbi:IS6 family transposase [Saccharolobus islandicus]|uniref:IS6 family transposase n=1 Tax=Saccharolobus islandicus TaxID=43080 RepID=UPI0003746050|nr:IS6 family transposase [Sulfolobus islandicus]
MGTRWKVPVLTQVILILMEYINLSPRFYSRETVASALANYVSGLSSWRAVLPHSTLLYYHRRLSYVKYAVPLSGIHAIDETKVRLTNGQYYYVWIVRDVKTKAIPFFMITSVRSGVHVLVVLANMKRAEEVARRIFKVMMDKVIYLHDGAAAYNAFSWLNVEHEKVMFNERDYAEQGFRSLKHRLASMDFHFPWNSNKFTLARWLSTFFLIYNILYTPTYLLDKGVIINVNISNE